MNTGTFGRLIFLKDMRALRLSLLVLAALALSFVLLPLGPTDEKGWAIASSLQFVIFGLGPLLLVVSLIHADPTAREFRFLLTRPVPGAAIGLAKIAFLAAFAAMPYWLSLEYLIARSGVPLNALDHFLLLAETFISAGAVMAMWVLCCAFVGNRLVSLVLIAALMIVPSLLGIWWHQQSFHSATIPRWPDMEHERLSRFCTLLGNLAFLVVSLIAIGWRYRTKRLFGPLILALGGYSLSLLAAFWPYNLASGLQDQSNKQSLLSPTQLDRIHMTLVTQNGRPHSYDLSGGGWNDVRYVNLNQSVRLEGIELPYFVQTVGYHATITLRSGKTITSDYADYNSHGGVGGRSTSFNAVVAGVIPAWPIQPETTLDLLTYIPKNLPQEDITGATVKGVIILEVRRAYVAGFIPMKVGASFAASRQRYVVTRSDFSDNGVSLDLNCFQVPIVLRGDLVNWNTSYDFQRIGVYRPFNEELKERQSSYNGGASTGAISLSHRSCAYTSADRDLPQSAIKSFLPNWRPLPPDWTSGAELVFVGSDYCGQISLPYEIDNVDLHYRF